MNKAAINAESRTSQQAAGTATTNNLTSPLDRRQDLDTLRAIAMLLGILLHASLSFARIPWTVQDSRESDYFYLLFDCIHGFRMPLCTAVFIGHTDIAELLIDGDRVGVKRVTDGCPMPW